VTAVSDEPGLGATSGEDEATAFAPFRPRRGRRVALASALVSVLTFGIIAVFLPDPAHGGNWQVGDKIFFAGVGLAIALMLWRFAAIRAVPTRAGLRVRNLMLTRTVEWGEIVDLRFSGGDPWVVVELDDTDTLAVMAIQKSDGDFGRAEARRLAALVQALGSPANSPADGI
jgi:MFS family permease